MTPLRVLATILDRAEAAGWAGPDPYDGLTSGLGRIAEPLGSLPRFAVTQAVLRFPLLRRLARPPATLNAKALGLFLGAAARGQPVVGERRAGALSGRLLDGLEQRGISVGDGIGWGYPFPWQSRLFWAPAGTPNAVVTSTVGWHLLNWDEEVLDPRAYRMGCAAARFLATALPRSRRGAGEALAYTPRDRTRVVNVSALAARLLARVSPTESAPALWDLAERLARFVVSAQREDGSWPYSADAGGSWDDSFHTGYVLEALLSLRELGMDVSGSVLTRGYQAYARFFARDGAARLLPAPDSLLDAHSAAQGIITYAAFAQSLHEPRELRNEARAAALRIARWALEALWLPERGYFAYRIVRNRRDERDFTRWVQAWMALAMATVTELEPALDLDAADERAAGIA